MSTLEQERNECGFVDNCLIKPRDGQQGPLFVGTLSGIHPRLDGYAIVPRDEYEAKEEDEE